MLTTEAPPEADRALRALRRVGRRRLDNYFAAVRLAERQATLLRRSLGVTTRAFPDDAFGRIGFITIGAQDGLPVSGSTTQRADGRYAVAVAGDEPRVRQRFSAAHEIKHAIDDRDIGWLYGSPAELDFDPRVEQLCDRFAAALLMPAPLVRQDWIRGYRAPAQLARRYEVSLPAMARRLRELGLQGPRLRHGNPHPGGTE